MPALQLLSVCVGLLSVAGLIVWAVFTAKKNIGGGNVAEAPLPVSKQFAVAKEKRVHQNMTGTYQMPGHYLTYEILFGLDDNTEVRLKTTKEIFDEIPLGVRRECISRGEYLLDFGNKYGKDGNTQ